MLASSFSVSKSWFRKHDAWCMMTQEQKYGPDHAVLRLLFVSFVEMTKTSKDWRLTWQSTVWQQQDPMLLYNCTSTDACRLEDGLTPRRKSQSRALIIGCDHLQHEPSIITTNFNKKQKQSNHQTRDHTNEVEARHNIGMCSQILSSKQRDKNLWAHFFSRWLQDKRSANKPSLA
jgi:hypothetical protein